jgi:ribulose-5-phosphate 4-epimerase/fuculose-1-phosphate aldolase
MANYGAVTYGRDQNEAHMRMEAIENYAKIVLVARQLGCARTLDRMNGKKLDALQSHYRGLWPAKTLLER